MENNHLVRTKIKCIRNSVQWRFLTKKVVFLWQLFYNGLRLGISLYLKGFPYNLGWSKMSTFFVKNRHCTEFLIHLILVLTRWLFSIFKRFIKNPSPFFCPQACQEGGFYVPLWLLFVFCQKVVYLKQFISPASRPWKSTQTFISTIKHAGQTPPQFSAPALAL